MCHPLIEVLFDAFVKIKLYNFLQKELLHLLLDIVNLFCFLLLCKSIF